MSNGFAKKSAVIKVGLIVDGMSVLMPSSGSWDSWLELLWTRHGEIGGDTSRDQHSAHFRIVFPL